VLGSWLWEAGGKVG